MTKKNKISLQSELHEIVVNKVINTQEQTLYTNAMDFQYFDTDKQNVKTHNKCAEYQKNAERIARIIVKMDWQKFTADDLTFYNRHMDSSVPCVWMTPKTVNEYIYWIEDGEPGFCDNPWHCILPIVEIGVLFIPGLNIVAALGLSMAAGVADGLIYYHEDEKRTAGLVIGLSMLPLVPSIAKKFPFVKAWGKAGSKTMVRFINGEAVTVLEYYQPQSIKANTKFIEKEILQYTLEKAAKESIELAGQKVTKETLEKAMKDGFLEITIGGVTRKVTSETIEALTKKGVYTVAQQSKLIKFGKAAVPYIIAGFSYIKIYNEVAKTGVLGPQDLIRQKWGIEPRDSADIKINKFFTKVADHDAVLPEYETNWEFIKTMFNADGSGTDGELMVQAIKAGWNPYKEGTGVVPTKYRTEGYKEWVENILSNEELVEWFESDGSEEDNALLLLWVFDNPDFESGMAIDEKYHTETRKKRHEEEKARPQKRVLILPDGTVIKDDEDEDEDYEFDLEE